MARKPVPPRVCGGQDTAFTRFVGGIVEGWRLFKAFLVAKYRERLCPYIEFRGRNGQRTE